MRMREVSTERVQYGSVDVYIRLHGASHVAWRKHMNGTRYDVMFAEYVWAETILGRRPPELFRRKDILVAERTHESDDVARGIVLADFLQTDDVRVRFGDEFL